MFECYGHLWAGFLVRLFGGWQFFVGDFWSEGFLCWDFVHEVDQVKILLIVYKYIQTFLPLILNPWDNEIPDQPIKLPILDPWKLLIAKQKAKKIPQYQMRLNLFLRQWKQSFGQWKQTTYTNILNHNINKTTLERNRIYFC